MSSEYWDNGAHFCVHCLSEPAPLRFPNRHLLHAHLREAHQLAAPELGTDFVLSWDDALRIRDEIEEENEMRVHLFGLELDRISDADSFLARCSS